MAIVTGGSRGIGAATAVALARHGYDVALSYLSHDAAADQVVSQIRDAGRRGLAVRADCGTEAGILHLFKTADREFGTLDVLVANAGIVGAATRLEELSWAVAERVFAINAVGVIISAREAVRRMSTAHGGRGGKIVAISSVATKVGSPNEWTQYAASKGAVDIFIGGLAREVAAEGIRVNAVSPGLIDTDLHSDAGVPERVARLSAVIPMRRAGTPEEVAETVAWVACDAPDYLTGSVIEVSGGR